MIRRRPKQTAAAAHAPALPPVLPPMIEQAAQIEAELAGAREDLAAAQAEVLAAQRTYEAAADGARVSEAVAARTRILEAETLVDVASRHVARLDAELQRLLDGAADAAAAAEREQLRVAALHALAEYEAEFRAVMPVVTSQLRRVIRMQAQAEMAREAAAAAGVHLPRADAFRDIAGSPRVEISRQVRDLWLNPFGGMPYGDEDQQEIRTEFDGGGVIMGNNYAHRSTRKRRYVEITFRPAVMGQMAPALFEALALPCIDAGSPAGWAALKASTSPRQVLEALNALEARQDTPRPEPEVRTERQPIEPARDVRLNPDPPPFREVRGPYGSMDNAPADVHAADA